MPAHSPSCGGPRWRHMHIPTMARDICRHSPMSDIRQCWRAPAPLSDTRLAVALLSTSVCISHVLRHTGILWTWVIYSHPGPHCTVSGRVGALSSGPRGQRPVAGQVRRPSPLPPSEPNSTTMKSEKVGTPVSVAHGICDNRVRGAAASVLNMWDFREPGT